MEADVLRINGRIIFNRSVAPFSNATIYIYAEDISHADSLAPLLAKVILSDISHNPASTETHGETIIPFNLTMGTEVKINPKNNYNIRAMVEINKGDNLSKKVLNTDESFPILTNGYGRFVEIPFK